MPKRPLFESAIHHLLLQAKHIADHERVIAPEMYVEWGKFINSIEFTYIDNHTILASWVYPKKGELTFSIKNAVYYSRGDMPQFVKMQAEKNQLFENDQVKAHNDAFFASIFRSIAKKAGMKILSQQHSTGLAIAKIGDEEELSDVWAESIDPSDIDVILTNSACTSPELRYIHQTLGNVQGKRILDLGCGLGEVSIFFALKGAKVTAIDLSRPMLDVVQALAKRYKVKVNTKQATVENLTLSNKERFDVVYVGNLFHHVDIEKTMVGILRVLKPNGVLVSWDPVEYNPIINIYRRMATKVRSHDERPFRLSDIAVFRKYFGSVSVQWFWFSTLIIFIVMALVQGRNPNKERYWKSVIAEADRWKWLYIPLESFDKILLRTFPILGPLCWNICLICTKPVKKFNKR